MKRIAVLVFGLACAKHEERIDPVALPSVASTTTAAHSTTAPAIDATAINTCTVTFDCGLSHPGLGTSSRTTSVDLGKCERASWSDSGPYDPTSPRNPPPKKTSKLLPADCDRLRDLASSLGPADVAAASESAHIDSEACSLSITCAGDAADRLRVQRQTTTGTTRVERAIRAVLGQ